MSGKRQPEGRRGRTGKDDGKSQEAMDKTRCPYCQTGQLKPMGASDAAGGLSWKCRRCGRRVWKRAAPKPPVPLVPARADR